jgi:hypothetical protein
LEQNLINIGDDDLDTPIYRVFNLQRLVELFTSKANTLVKPAMWDDPLENYVLRVAMKAFRDHPHSFDFTAKDRFYGQCWSTIEESDALWRIYSPDKSGVKVKTTIRKLLYSLQYSAPVALPGKCFIGKVNYLLDEILREKLQNRFWLSLEAADPRSQAASLLFKRLEFEHEKEVRLIYLNEDQGYIDNLFRYSIEPAEVFEDLQFDPRLSRELFDVFKYYFEANLLYPHPVTRSELYKVPDLHL